MCGKLKVIYLKKLMSFYNALQQPMCKDFSHISCCSSLYFFY